MMNHEVEVAQIDKPKTNDGREAGTTTGSIIVKPPITIGEFFDTAIRGRDGHGARLTHVLSTAEATVFVAASYVKSNEEQEAAIFTIANRIKRLADSPEKVIELLNENPFPKPQTTR